VKTEYSLATTGRGKRPRRPLEIMMTPMIDVIFLLLVFFLATSSFQIVEQLMPGGISELKASAGAGATPPDEISNDTLEQVVVKLVAGSEGTIARFNGVDLGAFDELRERFGAIGRVRAGAPIIIDPMPSIQAADVIRAYDWARQAGLTRVYLATRPAKA
jgi:biopolymer transport protein ExbD